MSAAVLTPAMFLTDAQLCLLGSAEAMVYEFYCTNHCIHHDPLVPCAQCMRFVPARDGEIACDGYQQVGERR